MAKLENILDNLAYPLITNKFVLELTINRVKENKDFRDFFFNRVDDFIYHNSVEKNIEGLMPEAAQNRYSLAKAGIRSLQRALDENRLSKGYKDNFLDAFLVNTMLAGIPKRRALMKKGIQVPSFILIDPTSLCNLNCEYCYADAGSKSKIYGGKSFSYNNLKKLMNEARDYLGVSFFVFSGGEPTMWRDKEKGKDIADIFDEYKDNFFILFTNGTVLNPTYAKKHNLPDDLIDRFSETGNVLPCVSQEGEETNKRRGKVDDIYLSDIIGEVSELMVKKGIPFLYSVTVTRNNAEYVGSFEFHDQNLKKGALGEWNFHALPIGRIWNKCDVLDPEATIDVVITPEQRKWLYEQNWKYVKEKEVFIGDFWNAGAAAANKDCLAGCIAAARNGGHFAVRANGDITPCVFFPLVDKEKGNIYQIWEIKGNIIDATQSRLFKEIRGNIQKNNKNYMLPCSFKDEFRLAKELYDKGIGRAFDPGSEELLKNPELYRRFTENVNNCKKIMTPKGM